jgi:sugar lactone lactonase YvrE
LLKNINIKLTSVQHERRKDMRKYYIVSIAVAITAFIPLLGFQHFHEFLGLRSLLAQPRQLFPGEVEIIMHLPEGDKPEGVALDPHGNIYVGNRRQEGNIRFPEILKITPEGSVSVLATLEATSNPSEESLLGLATDASGNVYAALHSFDPAINGVYMISSDGTVMRFDGSHLIGFPNALTFDPSGNLYVTDSFTGMVWRIDGDGNVEPWIQHELLAPDEEDPFGFPIPGANGIAYYPPNQLYVANTEKGLVARVYIQPDGEAGMVELVSQAFDILTIDGIAVDAQGTIYGVIAGYSLLGSSPLVNIDPHSGEITRIISEDQLAKFDFPLSLAFGRGARDQKSVFVTNGDLPIAEGGPGPGLVQVGIGVPGFPGK